MVARERLYANPLADQSGRDEDGIVAAPAAPSETARGRIGGQYTWVLARVATGVLVVWGASVVVFLATVALPGDPARSILGRRATPEQLTALREKLNLNRPLMNQYMDWATHFVQGDFGRSLVAGTPVTELIAQPVVYSLVLFFLVVLVSLPLSVALGAATAVRRDTALDRAANAVSMVLNAVPDFVIAVVLVIVFATTIMHMLPAVALIPRGDSPLRHIDALVLPTASLVLVTVAYLMRLVRASMIDVLQSDYVQMAQLKGVPLNRVVLRHALPNALIPMIQASAVVFGILLSGTVVIEFVYNYPGLGSRLLDAINNRDIPVVQAVVMIYAIATVVFNIVADVLTVMVTPRLRIGH